MSPTYTVSQLNAHVRRLLEGDFRDLWVEGEISNLSRPASGHIYFSLKDSDAQVACALFRGSTFGLRLPARNLANGIAVRVHGRATLFEPRGGYQLILDQIEAAGVGAMEAELQRRREMLTAEGCFLAANKRPIPRHPRQIGIITSLSGAAVHDAITTLRRRNPLVSVILYPSLVQGAKAPPQLIRRLHTANRRAECDTLLLIRGGGSAEDLWAYNDPDLVRAIAASRIPIISGVGHETDVTLADLAADLRAPTPTAAAEQSCPDLSGEAQRLHRLGEQLHRAVTRRLERERMRLDHLDHRLDQQQPARYLDRIRQHLDELDTRMRRAVAFRCRQEQNRLHHLMQTLHSLSPLNILERGYAVTYDSAGKVVSRSDAVQPGEKITVRLGVGRLYCTVNRRGKT